MVETLPKNSIWHGVLWTFICIAIYVGLLIGLLYTYIMYDPERIAVNLLTSGIMRHDQVIKRAIYKRDIVIPELRRRSGDFTELNDGADARVAFVLSQIGSSLAESTARELLDRQCNTISSDYVTYQDFICRRSRVVGAFYFSERERIEMLVQDPINTEKIQAFRIQGEHEIWPTHLHIWTVGLIGTDESVRNLSNFLNDERDRMDSDLLAAVIVALGLTGNSNAIDSLRNYFALTTMRHSSLALQSLLSLGDNDSIEIAGETLPSLDPKEQQVLIEYLRFIEALKKSSTRVDDRLRSMDLSREMKIKNKQFMYRDICR